MILMYTSSWQNAETWFAVLQRALWEILSSYAGEVWGR
jgi:hypothetical protein